MTYGDRRVFDSDEPAEPAFSPQAGPPQGPPGIRSMQPFTTAFIAVCVAVGVIDFLTGRRAAEAGLLFGPAVTDGQWWRVLTTAVLHGGLIHLVMNMMATYDLGGQLERGVGTLRVALITAISAFGSGAMVLLFSYWSPTVGASGVICGYVGAMLPIATHEGRRILTSLVIQIAIISLLPFVSWQGHLGGFLAGILCGFGLKLFGRKFLAPGLLLLAFTVIAAFFAARLGGALVAPPGGELP